MKSYLTAVSFCGLHSAVRRFAGCRWSFTVPFVSAAVLGFAGMAGAMPFTPVTPIPTVDHKGEQILTGQLNGDSLPDVAILSGGNSGSTLLAWYVNTGAGNFMPGPQVGVPGFEIAGAQAEDLDSDGDADVVLHLQPDWGRLANGQVAVFRNNGNNSFTQTQTQTLAVPGYALIGGAQNFAGPVMADVDNDGDLDAAVGWGKDSQVHVGWCANNGSGSLAAPAVIHSGFSPYCSDLRAADFTGDGRTDICLSIDDLQDGSGQSALALYTGMGGGSFGAPVAPNQVFRSIGELRMADFNKDGRLDALTTMSYNNGVRVRMGTGSGFAGYTNTGMGAGASTIGTAEAGDLDEDGDADILCGVDDRLLWQMNPGSGVFGVPVLLAGGLGGTCLNIKVLDVDLDGDADIIGGFYNALRVFRNDAIHRTVEAAFPANNSGTIPIASGARLICADFDRDGDEDFAVLPGDGSLRWIPLNGDTPGAPVTVTSNAPQATALAAGDLTGDGVPDIVVGMPATGQIHIFRNVGFGASWTTAVMPAMPNVRALHIADVDMDGAPDVLASSHSNNRTTLFRNVNRDATVWTQEQVAGIPAVDQIATVQFQRPGRAELVLTAYDPDVALCQTYRLQWNGSAWTQTLMAQGNGDSSIAVTGDLNGDGSEDFVRSLGYGAAWQPNYNNGVLNPAQPIPDLPDGFRCGRLADLNGDGRPDLVVAGADSVAFSRYAADGNFAPAQTILSSPGAGFRDLLARDFDHDGDVDLAVADSVTDRVRLLVNRAGQYDTTSAAPQTGQRVWPGDSQTLVRTAVQHLGLPLDASLTVESFRVRLQLAVPQANNTWGYGAPMTTAQAASVIQRLELVRDFGVTGVYEPGVDLPVAAETSFTSITDGYLNLSTAGAASGNIQCPGAQTIHFLVRVHLTPSAAASSVDAFMATVYFGAGQSKIVHSGTAPAWELRDRGAPGNLTAVVPVGQPTALQNWRFAHWNQRDNTGAAANDADPDGDGNSNLLEYVIGGNPKLSDNDSPIAPLGLTLLPINDLQASLRCRLVLNTVAMTDPTVKVTIESSVDLTTWSSMASCVGGGSWTGVAPTVSVPSGDSTAHLFNTPIIPQNVDRTFLRIQPEEL